MNTYPTPELFRHYPELRERIAWIPLARATPVHRLVRMESYLHGGPIWVKRDDRTSDIYGGDKARKFEFVFGDVVRRGATRVLAVGSMGSSHCLAVAAFARHFHLRTLLALSRQRQMRDVQRTLQMEQELGAELHRLDGGLAGLVRLLRSALRRGPGEPRLPHVLWPGRIARLGALGYVSAALEIRRQINCGILPAPERIYVPVGTGATLAGLALGCRLAGIGSELVGVLAHGRPRAHPERLARRVARDLRRRTRRFPPPSRTRPRISLRRDFAGGPSLATSAAQHALGLVRDLETLDLDAGYGARTMAALIEDVRAGGVRGPVLFWLTHPAQVYTGATLPAEALPPAFRGLFVAG